MQIQLGAIIRQLRTRDGRTQEMLAAALGVTSQAVSRWESGGGYPDLELIPAIANYFHVTIDELFGCQGQREQRLREFLSAGDQMLRQAREMDDCVALLRDAAGEFPAEPEIQFRLATALTIRGFQVHGARSLRPRDGSDGIMDLEYNRQNRDFEEALALYRRVLPELTDPDSRSSAIRQMVRLYSIRGEQEQALQLAMDQLPLSVSRECLLPRSAPEAEKSRFQGEALLALAWEFANAVLSEVTRRDSLRSGPAGIQKLEAAAELYRIILDDGNMGFGHYALYTLYRNCARFAGEQGRTADQKSYHQLCREHGRAYAVLKERGGIFRYTAPLVAHVTADVSRMPPAPEI